MLRAIFMSTARASSVFSSSYRNKHGHFFIIGIYKLISSLLIRGQRTTKNPLPQQCQLLNNLPQNHAFHLNVSVIEIVN